VHLYITECIEEDIFVYTDKFGKVINNYLDESEKPYVQCLVALFDHDGFLKHMGVTQGLTPITITDRYGPNGPIRTNQDLDEVKKHWKTLSENNSAIYTERFYHPKPLLLTSDLYFEINKETFWWRFKNQTETSQ
jgi:hypothetical protein